MNCFIKLKMEHPAQESPPSADSLTGEAFQLEENGNTTILPAEPQEGLSRIKGNSLSCTGWTEKGPT